MNRYIVIFSKKGYAKYISHLDINRLFRRTIRKQGITLAYSHGFNPHPKLSFGQPLSLGYSAEREILEMETIDNYQPWFLKDKLSEAMPDGIEILDCKELDDSVKSLAANADYAVYEATFSCDEGIEHIQKKLDEYLKQDHIMALKKSKKKKDLVEVDIKDKIRELKISHVNNNYVMSMILDCGSISNLSPELVISTFMSFAGFEIKRSDIEVCRKNIGFKGFTY